MKLAPLHDSCRRASTVFKKLIFLCLFSAIVAAGAYVYIKSELETFLQQPMNVAESEYFQVERGMNLPKLVQALVASEKIKGTPFVPILRLSHPKLTQIKVGTFEIKPNMMLQKFLEQVVTGVGHQFSIRFMEGSRFSQWRDQLAQAEHLDHQITAMSDAEVAKALDLAYENLDGLLLPETYNYTKGMSDLDVLKRAASALKVELDKQWADRSPDLPLKSAYEVLTLASIIEKETAADEERGKVASVFINRLNLGMKLQTDPTVIYGMGDQYDGNIRRRDLQNPTPYNTYVIDGLPPSPIAMVSKKSIYAATHPDETKYLYFVATGTGGHAFNTSLDAHNRSVRAYLKVLKSQQ